MNFELAFLVLVAAVSTAAAGSASVDGTFRGGVGVGKRSGE